MTGIEAAVGLLVGWLVSKARRVGRRADSEVDQVLDAGMDRLHDVVAAKLGKDTTKALEAEADRTGEVSDGTVEQVRTALRTAAAADPAFAEQVATLVREVQALVVGEVNIQATDGSIAAWHIETATVGGDRPDPRRPGRPTD